MSSLFQGKKNNIIVMGSFSVENCVEDVSVLGTQEACGMGVRES